MEVAIFRRNHHVLTLQAEAFRAHPLPHDVAAEGGVYGAGVSEPIAAECGDGQLVVLNEDVVWLDVAMHDVAHVHVAETGKQLLHDITQLPLAEVAGVPAAARG